MLLVYFCGKDFLTPKGDKVYIRGAAQRVKPNYVQFTVFV